MIIGTIRERANITQAELAKRVGTTQGAISHYERGTRMPRVEMILKIARELNCTTDELLSEAAGASPRPTVTDGGTMRGEA